MGAEEKQSGLVQGTLHMLILRTLALEPMHGYGIGVRLEQISQGVLQVNAGSLFPALRRLERDDLISGKWRVTENNRRAKYYTLTSQGRAKLKRETRDWEVAYVTAQRTGEIGIRMALGADHRDVRWLVLRGTVRLVVVAVVIGIPAALAGARVLSSQLYEVAPNDPLAVAVGLATLSIAALLAGYLPARRAARVDPVVALRAE